MGRRDDGEAVDQGLDLQLLDDAHQRVGDHGAEEEDIFDLAGKYDEKGQRDI